MSYREPMFHFLTCRNLSHVLVLTASCAIQNGSDAKEQLFAYIQLCSSFESGVRKLYATKHCTCIDWKQSYPNMMVGCSLFTSKVLQLFACTKHYTFRTVIAYSFISKLKASILTSSNIFVFDTNWNLIRLLALGVILFLLANISFESVHVTIHQYLWAYPDQASESMADSFVRTIENLHRGAKYFSKVESSMTNCRI